MPRKRSEKQKPPFKFIRFNPLHKEAQFMLPRVIIRIKTFINKYTPEINADDFVSYILTLAQEYPDAVRIWVALTQNNEPVGHFIVTADVYLSEIYLHIQQLSIDDANATRHVRRKVLKSMYNWVRALNMGLAGKGANQIHRLYLTSAVKRNMVTWQRFLPGCKLVEERRLGIFELPEEVMTWVEAKPRPQLAKSQAS